jgi:hypothetical protein
VFFKAFDLSNRLVVVEGSISVLLCISAMIYGQGLGKFEQLSGVEVVLLLIMFLVICLTGALYFDVQNDFLEQVAQFLENQDIFKKVLSNFNDPLLIMCNSKTEFLNHKFKTTFHSHLTQGFRNFEENEVDGSELQIDPN